MKRKIFFIFGICVFFATLARAKNLEKFQKDPIDFQADSLEYRQEQKVVIASGNVVVEQTSYTFKANRAQFDLDDKTMQAQGEIRFKDIWGNNVESDFLDYNFADGSARLQSGRGTFGPWVFAAQEINRQSDNSFLLRRARLATCEKDLSKYHLSGQKIILIPGKRLAVYHAIFRVGPFPILYLPYYYYSLGEKHLAFQIFPGQNRSEGFFVRTVWGFPFTPNTYSKLYLDHLSRRGIGTGLEHSYLFGDRAKGSIYAYQIQDQLNDKMRWNARVFHWQRFSDQWIMQANINRLSDDEFPNDFFREDFDRVVRDLKSQLAFTWTKESYTARILSEVKDEFNVQDQKFFTAQALAPQVELSQNLSSLGFWGIQKNWNVNFINRYAGSSDWAGKLRRQYRLESNGEFALTRSFLLWPWGSYTQTFKIVHFAVDKVQGEELTEKFTQRAVIEGTLRQRLSRSWDVDLTYLFDQRLQKNTGQDLGRQAHQLSILSSYQPSQQTNVRFETIHFLPGQRGQALAFLDPQKYSPLRGEFSYIPNDQLEVFFREEYQLFDQNTGSKYPLSSQSEVVYGRRAFGEDYFAIGSSYFSSLDKVFQLRTAARSSVLKWIQLEVVLRSNFTYKNKNIFEIESADFIEKEITGKTQWRCWNFLLTFRERKGVYEFLFNVELQTQQNETRKSSPSAIEQNPEFYPWR